MSTQSPGVSRPPKTMGPFLLTQRSQALQCACVCVCVHLSGHERRCSRPGTWWWDTMREQGTACAHWSGHVVGLRRHVTGSQTATRWHVRAALDP